ncbi:MAG: dipeptidase [Rikenellaceae bacterium]|nr:dipeptidase [Rikenellaceae bacterium]
MKRFILLIMTIVPLISAAQRQVTDAEIEALHDRIISIDTHNDFSLGYCFPNAGFSTAKGQVSFEMMIEGRLDCAVFAAYIDQGKCDEAGHEWARNRAETMVAGLKRYVAENEDKGVVVYSAAEIERAKQSGKRAMMISIENCYCFGTDLTAVEHFYNMGVRMATLTHNGANEIADTCVDQGVKGGLTEFGRKVIAEMNRLGMVIDVSHASRLATLQAAELSEVPIIASHSGVYGVRAIRRNLTDKEILAIAAKGGVVQVAIVRSFISNKPKGEESLADLVAHVDYLVKLVGVDHVGFGSDFDGGGGMRGCRNMSQIKNVTRALMEAGYSDEDIAKMWGGNTLRVMKAVEEYAANQRR